ncbi:sialin-like isoform X1 [Cotesia glomerata]|uniref:sialin-like isoform X1 n=2 Tax=Cotesia glomerata TaxID=32391 RepID=UPI001D00B6E9|nr:sialin-like isoform X1 [Cotesia glomerata]
MGKEFLSCRNVLWILVFCGFAINYMLRINMNLAIVAMIIPRAKAAAVAQCSAVYIVSPDHSKNKSTDLSLFSTSSIVPNSSLEQLFDWDEYDQGLALGAYYWLHWLSQLPGGLLARRYGTKTVFGLGNFVVAILGLSIPFVTHYHLYALVTVRVLQGLISGVMWPAMHDMTAKWIPQNERSKFVSAYMGSSIGAAITYPLCALIINLFNWEAAFYITSLLAIIWYCFWYFLVFDSPNIHPRISQAEQKYILEHTAGTVQTSSREKVPWKEILLSGPLWITAIGHWGGAWGFLTFMTQAPSYFNFVHGWNLKATGLFSGLPHILRMIVSYTYSIFSDWLLRTNRMSLKNVRKLANLVTSGGGAILTLGLAFSGCQPTLAILFMMTGTAVNGAVSAGTLANLVDLSPNFASVLLGLSGLLTGISGFISPLVVGILTNHKQTVEQWRLVFIIATANLAISAIVYTIWGTSDVQPWNESKKPDAAEEELSKLKVKINDDSRDTDNLKINNFNCKAKEEKKSMA